MANCKGSGEMPRPIKCGIDFFAHDTDASSGKTLYTLESRYGNDGYAFWFKLLEILGSQHDLSYDCNNPVNWVYLTARTRVSDEAAKEILNMLSVIDAIDSELWRNGIIWSQNFVDRHSTVFVKRKGLIPQKPSFCYENSTETLVSEAESTQSKVKKRKVKESKEKETRQKLGLYENVTLSDQEYIKLMDEFPYDYQNRIDRLSEYIASTGKSYSNHLATIRSWARKDADKQSKRDLLMEIIMEGRNEQDGNGADHETNPVAVSRLLQGPG